MPSVNEMNAVYLASGDPEAENVPSLMEPGTLGARFTVTNRGFNITTPRTRRYQIVRVDPAASADPTAGGPAYWVDRSKYLVTPVGAAGNLNQVAGVFNNVVTRGNYGCVQQGGPGYVTASAPAVGDSLIGAAGAAAGKVAANTAPTNVPIGVVANATGVSGRFLTDLNVESAL